MIYDNAKIVIIRKSMPLLSVVLTELTFGVMVAVFSRLIISGGEIPDTFPVLETSFVISNANRAVRSANDSAIHTGTPRLY